MTRMSKQGKRRAQSPRRHRPPSVKTGSRPQNLPEGFRVHHNCAPQEMGRFIPKVG
jgi:hypothetical protein